MLEKMVFLSALTPDDDESTIWCNLLDMVPFSFFLIPLCDRIREVDMKQDFAFVVRMLLLSTLLVYGISW